MDVPVRFIDSIINNPLLMQFLVHRWFFLLEYDPRLDQLRVYDTRSRTLEALDAYIGSEKPEHATIFAEDRWKMRALLTGELYGPLEMRFVSPEGVYYSREVDARPVEDPARGTLYVGYAKDITDQKNQTQELLEQARHDSLTQLYNNRTGKELIDRYLQAKDPYASCGMLVIDLDFFRNVNDCYGHLFGDKVLQEFARLLRTLFRSSDILVRFGGDEFVVFLKDIPNTTLLQKTRQLSESVQQVKFWENDYRMTCSIGACFLPENTAGYSFDQLFENADWALYQAKQNGRNQYVFCDNLRRYAQAVPAAPETADIDARYLHNDLISTAFELFEKNNSFETAIPLFLKIVGIRLQLDRITIVDTRIRERSISRQFQWTSPRAEPVSLNGESYTKEDFLTLFHSYDEYGTTVLQADNMGMYSPQGRALLNAGRGPDSGLRCHVRRGRVSGCHCLCGVRQQAVLDSPEPPGAGRDHQDHQRLPEQASGRERREPRHDLCPRV